MLWRFLARPSILKDIRIAVCIPPTRSHAAAMSFNRSLWAATGAQIGREARASMNAGDAWSTFWAPVINLARDPRWGRNLETPGEDPLVSSEYAVAFVQAFEHAPEDAAHTMASACCKHYVANEMEDTTEHGTRHWRDEFDAQITQQDLADSYMVPFQACVQQGNVTGLMCSYNAVNGVPSCANKWLLDTVARGEWGFDGYVTSDCDADSDVFYTHNFTKTPEEAVRAVLEAGTDVDCGGFVQKYAQVWFCLFEQVVAFCFCLGFAHIISLLRLFAERARQGSDHRVADRHASRAPLLGAHASRPL
jgi:beta-D-xylosidase 4